MAVSGHHADARSGESAAAPLRAQHDVRSAVVHQQTLGLIQLVDQVGDQLQGHDEIADVVGGTNSDVNRGTFVFGMKFP
jgi:hypothetical protein